MKARTLKLERSLCLLQLEKSTRNSPQLPLPSEACVSLCAGGHRAVPILILDDEALSRYSVSGEVPR